MAGAGDPGDRTAAGAACGLMCLLWIPPPAAPRRASLCDPHPAGGGRPCTRGAWSTPTPPTETCRLRWRRQPTRRELAHPAVPLALVVAQQAPTAPAEDPVGLPMSPTVRIHHLPGEHLLPPTSPASVRRLILATWTLPTREPRPGSTETVGLATWERDAAMVCTAPRAASAERCSPERQPSWLCRRRRILMASR